MDETHPQDHRTQSEPGGRLPCGFAFQFHFISTVAGIRSSGWGSCRKPNDKAISSSVSNGIRRERIRIAACLFEGNGTIPFPRRDADCIAQTKHQNIAPQLDRAGQRSNRWTGWKCWQEVVCLRVRSMERNPSVTGRKKTPTDRRSVLLASFTFIATTQ